MCSVPVKASIRPVMLAWIVSSELKGSGLLLKYFSPGEDSPGPPMILDGALNSLPTIRELSWATPPRISPLLRDVFSFLAFVFSAFASASVCSHGSSEKVPEVTATSSRGGEVSR